MRLHESSTLLMAVVVAASLGVSGCKLIFEPPEDAADRFLEAAVSRDYTTIDNFIEDEVARDEMRELAAAFNSNVYKGQSGYWEVVEIQEDETSDLVYVFIEVDVPQLKKTVYSTQEQSVEIMLEMERNNLVWSVYYVEGIPDLLKAIKRQQF